MTRAHFSSPLDSAVFRGILAVFVAVLTLSASPAAAQDDPPPSADLEAVEALVADLGCPSLPVDGLREPTPTPSGPGRNISGDRAELLPTIQLQCRYQINLDDGIFYGFDVILRAARDLSSSGPLCAAEPALDDSNPTTPRYETGAIGEGWARTMTISGTADTMDLLGDPREMVLDGWSGYLEALEPFTTRCQYQPVEITCPAITNYVAADVVQSTTIDLLAASCVYNGTDEENFERIEFALRWATDRSSLDAQRRACEDFGESPRPRVQVIGGDGVAAEMTIHAGVDLATYDPAPWLAAGQDIRGQVLDQATDCDEAGIVPVWTPLPDYLSAIYTPERVDSPPLPGVGGPAFFGSTDFTDTGAAPVAVGGGGPATPGAAVGASEPLSGWMRTALRIFAVVGLVVSLLGLLMALLLMRKETRIRPVMEFIRIGLAAVMAVVSISLFARGAPAWAVVAALAGGGLLGFLQGRNLSLRVDGDKVFAKRGVMALFAFAGGLVLIQIAGLLNRTGVIHLGIALSFASAAITVGLMVGRQPQFAELKRGGGVAVLLLVVGSLVAAPLLVDAPAAAQEDDPDEAPTEDPDDTADLPICPQLRQEGQPRCDAHEALIDLVPWDDIDYNGGLFFSQQKPWVTVEVPRAFAAAPDPITRTVEWDQIGSEGLAVSSFSVTETFTFALRDDGVCCSIDYEGEGSELANREGAEPRTETLLGPLDDINVYGDAITGDLTRATMLNVPFDAENLWTAEGVDECGRIVASTVPNSRRGQLAEAVYTRDGVPETPFDSVGQSAFRAPCDIDGFDAASALAAAPPALPRDQRSSPCPSRVELYPRLETPGFELQAHTMLGPLFTNPNEAICNDGSLFEPLQFGSDAKGATRNELALSFAGPDTATTWGDDETLAILDRPADTPAARVCAQNPDGTAVTITEDDPTCEVVSMHKIDDQGSWIMVWVDNQLADGPDVTIRASMPWGTYRYRCHHCSPDSPEVATFLGQFHDVAVEWIDGSPGFFEGLAGADEVSEDVGSVGLPEDEQTDDDATRAAAVAAVIAVLASGGMLATALADAGLSRDEFIDAIRNDPSGGIDSLIDGLDGISDLAPPEPPEEPPPPSRYPPGSQIVDQWGDALTVGEDGNLEFFDEEADRWRSLPAEEAQAIIADQIGELSIYDPDLGRRIYFDDPAAYDAYADRVRRQISGDFWTRTDEEWRDSQRRRDWDAARRADELAMAHDRALIEAWEEATLRGRDRALEGALQAAESNPELEAAVDAAIENEDFNSLAEIYSGWMWDQMAESQSEAEWQETVATWSRRGELVARTTEAAARTAMVVVTGPAGVGYTAAGLAAINAGSEGALAVQRGESAEQIAARVGLGVLAGGRDAVMGRVNMLPIPVGFTAGLNGAGDAMEAYTRARLDGLTHEQAMGVARVTYTSSSASHVAGSLLDRMAPGVGQQLGRAGLGGVAAGWSTWMQGGSFEEGFVDGLAGYGGGAVGGRVGGSMTRIPGAYDGYVDPVERLPTIRLGGPTLEDAILSRVGDAARPRGVIGIDDQPPPIQDAWDGRRRVDAPPTRVLQTDDDGVTRVVNRPPKPGEQLQVTDEHTVLAGLRDTAASRTGKQADTEVQGVIINTRNQIYDRADHTTIARTVADVPEVQAMLRPGDQVVMDTFSTPGSRPSLGADRDARMVIRRPRPDGGHDLIEIPRQHWERGAYSDFAEEARGSYRRGGLTPPGADDPEIASRIEHLTQQLAQADPPWSRQQIEDRAFAEAHNQLFTDRHHVEASTANSDQATRWVSSVDRDTVEAVSTRLRDEGRMSDNEMAFVRRNPQTGEDELVIRRDGDSRQERVVDPGEWRADHQERATTLRTEYEAWRADPDNNPKPDLGGFEHVQSDSDVLRTMQGRGTIDDPVGARLMWEEKSRFYAGINDPEAVEQARKGVNLLLAERSGLHQSGHDVPPLGDNDYQAMRVLLEAPHGAQLRPAEAEQVRAELGRIYGDPDMPMETALGRVAAAHEMLRFARPATDAAGPVGSTADPADVTRLSQQFMQRTQVDEPFGFAEEDDR